MPAEKRREIITSLSPEDAEIILYDWRFWARENQVWPSGIPWTVWLILAGRGFGKTRIGSESVRRMVMGGCSRIALVGETAADARDVMVEGESGVLSACWHSDRDNRGNYIGRPTYQPSKRRLTWENGAIATTYSADEPDQLRGPQHDGAWADEIAKWRYPDTWDQLMFGLRLGRDPRAVATTTPRPIKIIRELLADPTTFVTRGSTYENLANLAPTFAQKVIRRYEGTRLGRQELNGELLEDIPGALWARNGIDATRVKPENVPQLIRIVVAIDPAVSNEEGSDETGIVAAGVGVDNHVYVLADESGKYSPIEWARNAIASYKNLQADRIIAEVNNGGDLVENTIRSVDADVPYKAVHASRGKVTRAEPVSALYEQSRVHHVGSFAALEDQMCLFTSDFDKKKAGYSPDRMDALVWAITELAIEDQFTGMLDHYRNEGTALKKQQADGVRMKVAKGVSSVTDREGNKLEIDEEGCVIAPHDSVGALRKAGFTVVVVQ
jgi:phage terminase large subunit-like protein